MVNGASDIIDISAELRQDRESSYAIFQGDYDDKGREKWIFLPKSQVEWDGKDIFSMPEWLGIEKGLV
jgi:hypothetical protein